MQGNKKNQITPVARTGNMKRTGNKTDGSKWTRELEKMPAKEQINSIKG